MLQKNFSPGPAVGFEVQDRGLDPREYLGLIKKRRWFFLVPFVLLSAAGTIFTLTQRAIYRSEGKILIESQAIPTDLVKPTVSATAAARIQVIEQRVMTRENLLAIANKFQVFADRKGALSGTEMLDLMRLRAYIRPFELQDLKRANPRSGSIAFAVGFDDEHPDISQKVANELMTLILGEDARTRTNRAAETTKFLDREAKRLEGELASVQNKIADAKRKTQSTVPDDLLNKLASLRSEMQMKSAIYSDSHPEMKAMRQRIAALEQIAVRPPENDGGIEALERQKAAIVKNLDDTSQKLTVARRGELLERDQQSERLEVIEQPVMPGSPVKGTKLKLLVAFLGGAFASGFGAVFAAETLDRSIRRTAELARVVDPQMIVDIPLIVTKADISRSRKIRWAFLLGTTAVVVSGLLAIHFLWMPLDVLWSKMYLRIMSG
jgi:uncharacterized protein involved in exopolysaccharide biosynthesis